MTNQKMVKEKNKTKFSKIKQSEEKNSLHHEVRRKVLLVSSILVVLFLSISILIDYYNYRIDSQKVYDEYISQVENLLVTQVNQAVNYIDFIKGISEERLKIQLKKDVSETYEAINSLYEHQKDKIPKSDLEEMIIDFLRKIPTDNESEYYFMGTKEGTIKLLEHRPDDEGQNLLTSDNAIEQKNAMNAMIALSLSQGEGFVSYEWTKPNTKGDDHKKISYIKYFEPLQSFIGTGGYVEDIDLELKEEATTYLESIRYGDDGYIFASHWSGLTTIGPQRGQNVYNITDLNGYPVVQNLINASKEGGGFIEYTVPKGIGKRPAKKLSYVLPIYDWEWYIGTGIYIDQIEEVLKEKNEQLIDLILLKVYISVVVFIAILVVVYFISRKIGQTIQNNNNEFTKFFKEAVIKHKQINTKNIAYSEFKDISNYANQMITDRKKIESLINKKNEELNLANKEISKILNVKTNFLNQVAHDIRTPLTPITIILPMLKNEIKSKKQNKKAILKDLEIVTNNIVYLNQLVKETLNISRIDAGTIPVNKEILDIGELVNNIITTNNVIFSKDHIKVINKIAQHKYKIYADKTMLTEVYENLITNSLKYMKDKKELVFDAKIKQDDIILSMKDSGIGVTKSNLNKIFTEFYKVDKSRHDAALSSGLGLSICERLVKLNNGKIWATSKGLGKGTTIYMEFPVKNKE